MKNAGAVAVDERSRHADDLFRRAEQLRHRVALAAVVVVLVQLIHDKPVKPAAVPLLDVRAERIPPARAARRKVPVRVLAKRLQSVQCCGVLCLLHGMDCQLPMHPAVFRDLDPRRRHAWIHRCPQGTGATHTLMIAPVFHAERLRFRGRPAVCVVAAGQLYDSPAVWAAERAFSRVKQNRRAAHIAVSGFLLADNGVDAFVALPVLRVQAVACMCADIVVDAQDLRGKLLRGGVKERLELITDSFRDGHTEYGQIAGDGMDIVKAVRVLKRSGNVNDTGFQAIL